MWKFNLYGFLIGLGILLGAAAAEKARKQLAAGNKIYTSFSLDDFFWWLLISGVIGARVYHVIDLWDYYWQNPEKILAIWQGGMGIWGAIIGGLVGLKIFFLFKKKQQLAKTSVIQFLAIVDVLAFALPIGQLIGRLGNYFNQELYGLPTNLPWGIYINLENRLPGFVGFDYFHPLFAYEAILSLITFICLLLLLKFSLNRVVRPGIFFFSYLGLYGFSRFGLEFLRIKPWRWGILTMAQWWSLMAIILSIIFLTIKNRQLQSD